MKTLLIVSIIAIIIALASGGCAKSEEQIKKEELQKVEAEKKHREEVFKENLVIYVKFKLKYGEDYSQWTPAQQQELIDAYKK